MIIAVTLHCFMAVSNTTPTADIAIGPVAIVLFRQGRLGN